MDMRMGSMYTPRKSLDFKQKEATDKLIQLHPPADKKVGKWPTEFNNKTISLTEQKSNDTWDIDLTVNEIKKDLLVKSDIRIQRNGKIKRRMTLNIP